VRIPEPPRDHILAHAVRHSDVCDKFDISAMDEFPSRVTLLPRLSGNLFLKS
jgi:hypothetical protein